MDERWLDAVWFCLPLSVWACRRRLKPPPAAMDQAIRALGGKSTVKRGKAKLDLPSIGENGNTVPLRVTIDSPMSPTDDPVTGDGSFWFDSADVIVTLAACAEG